MKPTGRAASQSMLHHTVCFPVLQFEWWCEWLRGPPKPEMRSCGLLTHVCIFFFFLHRNAPHPCVITFHALTNPWLLQWWDSRLSNRWMMTNPSGGRTIPYIDCLSAIVQRQSAADTRGDGKPRRSFLEYYPEHWDVIAPDFIRFFFPCRDERGADSLSVWERKAI